MTKKEGFKNWFASNGDDLLKGWLRANEDDNKETFADWVLGEYDYYLGVPHKEIYQDTYEIPYHGIFDTPSELELLIFN